MKFFSGLLLILGHVLESNQVRNSGLRFHFKMIEAKQYWSMKINTIFVDNLIAYNALSDADQKLIKFFIIDQI